MNFEFLTSCLFLLVGGEKMTFFVLSYNLFYRLIVGVFSICGAVFDGKFQTRFFYPKTNVTWSAQLLGFTYYYYTS